MDKSNNKTNHSAFFQKEWIRIKTMSVLDRNRLLIELAVKEYNSTIMPQEIIQLQIIQAIRGANGEIDKVLKNWDENPDIDPRK
jgi:hypothetical protein